MRSRRAAAVVAFVTLALVAALPAAASAKTKPPHLLPLKPCNSVLVAADFRDDLEEVASPEIFAGVESSVCSYGSLEPEFGGGAKFLPIGYLGIECIGNIIKKEGGAPPGGCWRLAHATLVMAQGRAVERLAGKLKKGVKASRWPAGFSRAVLHNTGDRAEYGFSGEKAYGYLQVLNAQLTVEGTEFAMLQVLKDAAALL
jgi:hypothetical protein